MKSFMIKLDRICAWSLLGVMVAYFITGYGQTREIISPDAAKFIHDNILPIPSIIAFAIHSAYGMHISFKRWKLWNKYWRAAFIIYAIVLIAGVIVFQFVLKTGSAAAVVPTTIEL